MIQKKFIHAVSLTVTAKMYQHLRRLSDEWQCSIAEVIRDFIKEGLALNPDFPPDQQDS